MSCNNSSTWSSWKFKHSKLDNHQGYLKSNDIINLNIEKRAKNYKYSNNQEEFLRSHDIQFTVGNDTFQEVVCHNERLGGNDEVSDFIWILFLLRFCIKKKFFFYFFF